MSSSIQYIIRIFSIFMGFVSLEAMAMVTLPNIIGSHMVLQREVTVPIWGTADPAEKITVTFRDQKKTATADAQGKWLVKLDPLVLGEPATLTVAGTNTLTLTDVLVGEVWVGSGQSNMAIPVNGFTKDPVLSEAALKTYPQLRLFQSGKDKNDWQEGSASNNSKFSALLFYFGLKLNQELNVPVGVIVGAVGGTPTIRWMPSETIKEVMADPSIKAQSAKYEAANPFERRNRYYEEALAKWNAVQVAEMPATSSGTSPAPVKLKSKMQKPVAPLPAGESSFTGDYYEILIRPLIPFAIRGVLWDQGENGTGFTGIEQPTIIAALIKSWRGEWGQGNFAWLKVEKPWRPGCALNPADPVNLGAVPLVPLPKDAPGWMGGDSWYVTKNPNTFLVSTTDLVPGTHPENKSGYATRAARVALGAVYRSSVEYYGPVFDSMKVEGNKVTISYTHVGKGLAVPAGQQLQGFMVSGENRKFFWANAEIAGSMVVLTCPDVPNPVAVHYWPFDWANLFNADGLPAIGFRTETW